MSGDKALTDHELTLGSEAYQAHVEGELQHYSEKFRQGVGRTTLFEPVPPIWNWLSERTSSRIREATGNDLDGHLIERLTRQAEIRMISLGSGPCGIEIGLATKAPQASIRCVDINPELLSLARDRAQDLGLSTQFEVADLNSIELPKQVYDLVFCHASLHHVIELERLATQIASSLKLSGELIIVDVITQNGYQMWPETGEVVRTLFRSLPARFRLNHTAYTEPRFDEDIWEGNTSLHSMECIRSQEILPALAKHFTPKAFVPYFSISRRFLDTMYGPNYDLNRTLDMALANWIWELDTYFIETDILLPETFFGIFRPLCDASRQ